MMPSNAFRSVSLAIASRSTAPETINKRDKNQAKSEILKNLFKTLDSGSHKANIRQQALKQIEISMSLLYSIAVE